jgi:acetyl esterase/lipase
MAMTPTGLESDLTVRPRPLRRPRRSALARTLAMLVASCMAVLGACTTAPSSGLSETPVSSESPSTAGVRYGPDPAQLLDIHEPTGGAPVGTIVYLHSGGWISGTRTKVSELVASQLGTGWAVVSVDYRLAPVARGPEMLADIDRAVRWVRVNGGRYGIDVSTVVVAGGSAGGHLAAMAGAAAGAFVDPDLPSDLASVSPIPDGIIAMVGPADLSTFWQAGGWAPSTTYQMLGCALGPTDLGYQPCEPGVAEGLSPLTHARAARDSGAVLPPAFLAYGPEDSLVPTATQGDPLYDAWSSAAPVGATHYEHPPGAGHNLEPRIEEAALDAWLEQVATRSF